MFILVFSLPLYFFSQLYCLLRLKGRSLLISRLTAAYMLAMVLLSMALLLAKIDAWPVPVLLSSPVALLVQLGLLSSYWAEGK